MIAELNQLFIGPLEPRFLAIRGFRTFSEAILGWVSNSELASESLINLETIGFGRKKIGLAPTNSNSAKPDENSEADVIHFCPIGSKYAALNYSRL